MSMDFRGRGRVLPYFVDKDNSLKLQGAIDRFDEMCTRMQHSIYFSNTFSIVDNMRENVGIVAANHVDVGPSTFDVSNSSMYTISPPPTYPT